MIWLLLNKCELPASDNLAQKSSLLLLNLICDSLRAYISYRLPPIPLAYRLNPPGEKPSWTVYTSTVHRQFADKGQLLSRATLV